MHGAKQNREKGVQSLVSPETASSNSLFERSFRAASSNIFERIAEGCETLSKEEKNQCLSILQEKGRTLLLDPDNPPAMRAEEQVINTQDAAPTHARHARVNKKVSSVMKRIIEGMAKNGILRPCNSPWSSPVFLVPKPNGKWRFVQDLRELNKVTVTDRHSLPRIPDILDKMAGAKVFSTFDCSKGFWTIPLDYASQQRTAFSTEHRSYCYMRMPMGAKNSSAAFQRIMHQTFAAMDWDHFTVYVDDITIHTDTNEQMFTMLEQMLQLADKANLALHPAKAKLFRERIEILGHEVSAAGRYPLKSNVKAIQDYPRPRTPKQAYRFICMAGFYRNFIPNFASLVHPIQVAIGAHKGSTKPKALDWGEAARSSFERIRTALCSDPVLAHVNDSGQFTVSFDASDYALGATLEQEQPDGSLKPIMYASRAMRSAETR